MFSRSLELEEEGMGGGEKGQRSFLFSYFLSVLLKWWSSITNNLTHKEVRWGPGPTRTGYHRFLSIRETQTNCLYWMRTGLNYCCAFNPQKAYSVLYGNYKWKNDCGVFIVDGCLKQPHLAGQTDWILGEAAHLWCIWQSGTHFKQAISTYTGSFWHVASWFLCVILLWKINRLKHQCCVHLSPPTSWFIEKIHVEVQSPNHPFTQE